MNISTYYYVISLEKDLITSEQKKFVIYNEHTTWLCNNVL